MLLLDHIQCGTIAGRVADRRSGRRAMMPQRTQVQRRGGLLRRCTVNYAALDGRRRQSTETCEESIEFRVLSEMCPHIRIKYEDLERK